MTGWLGCVVMPRTGPGLHEQSEEAPEALPEWRPIEVLFEEAPAAVAIVRGPDHVHEACNPMYCRLVGRPRDALLNRAAREVLPELEAQGVWAGLDRVRSTREPFIAKALPARLDRRGDGTLEDCYFSWVMKPA